MISRSTLLRRSSCKSKRAPLASTSRTPRLCVPCSSASAPRAARNASCANTASSTHLSPYRPIGSPAATRSTPQSPAAAPQRAITSNRSASAAAASSGGNYSSGNSGAMAPEGRFAGAMPKEEIGALRCVTRCAGGRRMQACMEEGRGDLCMGAMHARAKVARLTSPCEPRMRLHSNPTAGSCSLTPPMTAAAS